MAGHKGGFLVPPFGPAEALMDMYAEQADAGVEMYLTERPSDIIPLLVDLDFRFEGGDVRRRYGRHHVDAIVDEYMRCARQLFVFDAVDAYVMEKPSPRAVEGGGQVKDGLHMVVPGIVSFPVVQQLMRKRLLPRLQAILREVGISNSVEDCVDEAVLGKNNWLMYGSCKGPGQAPYLVTGVYRWTGGYGVPGQAHEVTLSPGALARLLSIHAPRDVTPLKEGVKEKAAAAFPPKVPRVVEATPVPARGTAEATARSAFARGLAGLLSAGRAEGYSSWRGVGLALHGVDEGLLDAWVEFSRKCPSKFSQEVCETEWARMRPIEEVPNPVTMGSLVTWAREDDPEGFVRVAREAGRYNEYEVAVERLVGLKERIGDDGLKVVGGEHGVARFNSTKVGDGCVDLMSFLVNDRRSVYPPDGFRTQLQSSSGELDGLPVVFSREGADSVRFDTLEEDPKQRTSIVAKLNQETCKVRSLGIVRPNKGLKNLTDKILMNSVSSVMFASIRQYHEDMGVPQGVIRQLRQEHVLYGNPLILNIANNSASTIVLGDNIVNSYAPDSSGKHLSDWKIGKQLLDAGMCEDIVEVGVGSFMVFKENKGTWQLCVRDQVTSHLRKKLDRDERIVLTENDRTYFETADGGIKVLRTMVDEKGDETFLGKLDQPVRDCLPFKNGMFDAVKGEMRALLPEDYVSIVTGYDLIPADEIPSDAFKGVHRFYQEIFPITDERDLFQRVIGHALFGVGDAKHFVVLSDVRGGYNGKSAIMQAVEKVFGSFAGERNRNLLMAAAGGKDADSHSAGMMSYESKRLAYVDEIPTVGTFDLAKLKELSGCGSFGGRAAHSGTVRTFKWRALIVFCANEASFPAINAGSDEAFQKRMIAIKMRSRFVESSDPGLSEPFTFVRDFSVVERMCSDPEYISAHIHVLADAYRQYVAQKGELLLPEASQEFVKSIISETDPAYAWVQEFLQERVVLDPEGLLLDAEIRAFAWNIFVPTIPKQQQHSVKTRFKGLIRKRLENMGAKMLDTVRVDGQRMRNVWVGVTMNVTG
jgi:hypothetical protein